MLKKRTKYDLAAPILISNLNANTNGQAVATQEVPNRPLPAPVIRIKAVRYGRRVGFFVAGNLVMVFGRSYYKASAALALLGKRPGFQGVPLCLSTPHRKDQPSYHERIRDFVGEVHILPRLRSHAERLGDWAKQRGFELGSAASRAVNDVLDTPF